MAVMRRTGLLALLLAALTAGCATGRENLCRRLYTDNPRVQVAAIAEVIRTGDRQMAGMLVPLLDSDDEGVRFLAATGVHRLAGDCLDFCYPELGKRRATAARLRARGEQDGSTPKEEGPK